MTDFHSRLAEAKAKLPLDVFMQKRGFGAFVKASCKSPFRDEKKPSWGVFTDENGELKWKDFTTGETGDQIDFLATELGCSTNEALHVFLEEAGESKPVPAPRKKPHTPPPAPRPEPEPAPVTLNPFGWKACVDALTPEEIQKFAAWRGYSPEFVTWLKEQRYVGMYQGCPATPVVKDGIYVGCQYRTKEGPRYANATPGAKTPAEPLVIGEPTADFMLVMESQWDGFAIMEKLGFHCGFKKEMLCLVITRSASNFNKLEPLLKTRAESATINDVILVGQNDPPRKDGKPTGHETLENGVRDLCAKLGLTVKVAFPPKEKNDQKIKDVNDWVRADKDADIPQFLQDAKTSTKSKITIRSVGELLGFKFSDADNYFGDRVMAESQAVSFIGPPGVGKSRIILQLAVCMILGIKFIDIETHAPYKSWLFLQTENSNRRLQEDLKGIIHGLELKDEHIKDLNDYLHFHTLETDEDSFLSLDDEDSLKAIQKAITDLNPAFVVFDPLNTFTSGNLNDDVDMRAVCVAISRAVKRGNPRRVPVVLHHSKTGKAAAATAIGWDATTYGKNSKSLIAWARAQINIAPADPEDERKILFACAKNNNGRKFEPVGLLFEKEVGIYTKDPDFNLQGFKEEVGIEKKAKGGRPSNKPSPREIYDLLEEENIPQRKLKEMIVDKFQVTGKVAWYSIKDFEKEHKECVMLIGNNPYYSRTMPENQKDLL